MVLAMSVAAFSLNHGINNWLPEILRLAGMSTEAAGYWAAIPVLCGVVGSLTIPRMALPSRRLPMLAALIAAAMIVRIARKFDDKVAVIAGRIRRHRAGPAYLRARVLGRGPVVVWLSGSAHPDLGPCTSMGRDADATPATVRLSREQTDSLKELTDGAEREPVSDPSSTSPRTGKLVTPHGRLQNLGFASLPLQETK